MNADISSGLDAFGHYISGFVDAEGTFQLIASPLLKSYPHAMLAIKLRRDDEAILLDIKRYFGCGFITHEIPKRVPGRNANPTASFRVKHLGHLSEIIVPHFKRCSLRSKKAEEFEIWAKAVNLLFTVNNRTCQKRDRQVGRLLKWTVEEVNEIYRLSNKLHHVRTYESEKTADRPVPIGD